ncbi:hypothetical protein V4C53_01660 [Paraburkholderia azotifigens]|uniref:hypothetical protein n=1 Tax=Paraburkholderia azotifigens TaxID=2057004 RepID=UPI003181AB74
MAAAKIISEFAAHFASRFWREEQKHPFRYMVSKGYDRAQFEENFLSLPQSPDSAVTSLQPYTYKARSVAGDALRSCSENASATLQPLPDRGCSDVADRTGELGGNEKSVAGARRVNRRTTSGESNATGLFQVEVEAAVE